MITLADVIGITCECPELAGKAPARAEAQPDDALHLIPCPEHFLMIYLSWEKISLCGVAQLAARRLAVRQARVRFPSRHHREDFPTEHTSDEDMEKGFSEWRRMNVL